MTLRVRVVCRKSVVGATPELLRDAVAGRLEPITALYRPREEEPVRQVLARLRIEREDKHPFGVWRLYWSSDERSSVRFERLVGSVFGEQRRELFDEIVSREEPETQRVRDVLHAGKEIVSF